MTVICNLNVRITQILEFELGITQSIEFETRSLFRHNKEEYDEVDKQNDED